jgi:hypothetical protein
LPLLFVGVGKDWSFSRDAACSGDGNRIGFEGEGGTPGPDFGVILFESFKGLGRVVVVPVAPPVVVVVVVVGAALPTAFCALFFAFFLFPLAMFIITRNKKKCPLVFVKQ